MSLPVVSAVASNPVGWTLLGVAGFITYKAGKKSGLKADQNLDKPSFGDQAIKGAMKTFYKTQKSLGETFSKTGKKYSALWQEAKEEVGS